MSLSLLAMFDELRRCNSILLDSDTEEQFLAFALNVEEYRKKWNGAEVECRRLVLELQQSNKKIATLEGGLHHARRLFDDERKRRKNSEIELATLEKQLSLVRDLVYSGDQRNKLNDETKEKLAFLNNTTVRSRISLDPRHERLNTINEALNSSSSILSEMSFSRSEDDLDVSLLRNGRRWTRTRPSTDEIHEDELPAKKRRSSIRKSVDGPRSLVATTTVTVHRDGPVNAHAKIETMTDKAGTTPRPRYFHHKPSAPPPPVSETTDSDTDPAWPVRTPSSVGSGQINTDAVHSSGGFGFGPSGKITRSHDFVSKTVLIPENCGPCKRRICFAKIALRCRSCHASCHPECRHLVPLPCIPMASTPTRSAASAHVVADFAPSVAPMVPALIVHCLNEIEARGMKEVGLYRVPGSEREVRRLKEAFLRNKGSPNLAEVELHVLCGTVKDFLRSLREPLITHHQWQDFVHATDKPDLEDAHATIYQAMAELPQPNRDTLAFILLHLQRVSECVECKMPAKNLARVFGPTLVGYSSSDPTAEAIMGETSRQSELMELLLGIGADYYSNFIDVTCGEQAPYTPVRPVARQTSAKGFFNTPIGQRTFRNKGQKFFPTPTRK